jgi:uncharacterized RDD family membrane protein YckC
LAGSAYERQEPGASGPAPSPASARDSNVVGRRLAACLLDCSLVTTLSLVALTPLLFVSLKLVLILVLLLVFVLLFCVFYFAYVTVLEGFWGRMLGKALLGIEVIREEDGGVPDPGRAALRALTFLFVDIHVRGYLRVACLAQATAAGRHGCEHAGGAQEE